MSRNRLFQYFHFSGATDDEVSALSPADSLLPSAVDRWVRCKTIKAPHTVVYRWLCQLTIAPYSFDFIDFPGRHSPKNLIPGAEDLHSGQEFLIFSIQEYERNRFIAGISRQEFRKVYGTISVSYSVRSLTPSVTRLQANACIGNDLPRYRRTLLAIGDSIMAGRQLRRIKTLSERTSHREAAQ